jgi:hypothetical protein
LKEAYRSEAAWRDQRPAVLVIACSDGRFEAALDEFCARALGLTGYDRFFVPGGIQILRLGSLLPKFEWAGRRFLRFLVDAHGLERVICVTHEGCAWYRKPPWGPDAMLDLQSRQRRDLTEVIRDLGALWPALKVEGYHARPEGGMVLFEAVAV